MLLVFKGGRGLAGCGGCIFVSSFCDEDSWILVPVFIFIFDGCSVRCSCPSTPVDADNVLTCFALVVPSWFISSDDGLDLFVSLMMIRIRLIFDDSLFDSLILFCVPLFFVL